MGATSTARSNLFLPVTAFALLALAPMVFSDPFSLGIVTMTFLWAAASLAWNISGGYAGQFSLGHAGFYGIGAYTSTILFVRYGINPMFGALAGALLCALVAVLLGWITMRLRGTFFVMATLAFGAVVHISAVNWRDVTQGTSGLSIPLKPDFANLVFANKLAYAYLALGLVAIYYALSKYIEQNRLGYTLVAFRENDDAARALGIRTLRARILAFAVSAALTSICGTFHAQYYLYLDPDGVVSLNFSLQVALIAIIGGLGTAYGPILGSVLITPMSLLVQGSLGNQISGLNLFIYATIVIVVLLALPEGIGPAAKKLLQRRRAWQS